MTLGIAWAPCLTPCALMRGRPCDRCRSCQSKLAQVLKTRGFAQEAEQLLQRVVRGGVAMERAKSTRGLKAKLGPSHPETLYNAAMLASVMEVLGHAQARHHCLWSCLACLGH